MDCDSQLLQSPSIVKAQGLLITHRETASRSVKTYCDEAKSGLEIGRRRGLSQLLHYVVGTKQFYKAVLVYDVSRWGSLQDQDEAAHYELLCKAAGVQVHYCAEHFSNDGRPASLILKALKRVMAAEYSRELSDKVFAGMTRVVIRGFRAGAYPGYGFRRMLVSDDGIQRQQLSTDEQKSIATDRVIPAPGPATEVRVCRSIRLVTKGQMWVLPAARNERCRITLMAGMKPENEALEAFYLTTRLKNPCKVHITENSEWLQRGMRLENLRSFYEVGMARQWDSPS